MDFLEQSRATHPILVASQQDCHQSDRGKRKGLELAAGVCITAVVVIAALMFVYFRRVRQPETRKKDSPGFPQQQHTIRKHENSIIGPSQ
ncbi:hypothetical protein B0O80DRAFT_448873 [Mortierella sp. GBAus27b]|nr:hypothetical protein B0O80DRAFT_448873 [Mortierella sp. GBAus27b]